VLAQRVVGTDNELGCRQHQGDSHPSNGVSIVVKVVNRDLRMVKRQVTRF
jgi:hypothetical protein